MSITTDTKAWELILNCEGTLSSGHHCKLQYATDPMKAHMAVRFSGGLGMRSKVEEFLTSLTVINERGQEAEAEEMRHFIAELLTELPKMHLFDRPAIPFFRYGISAVKFQPVSHYTYEF